MSMDQTPHEILVARLLAQHEQHSGTPAGAHPTDEVLALFAEGKLSDGERATLVAHLADCGHCREITRLLLLTSDEAVETVKPAVATIPLFRRWPMQVLALAAGLMICVSMYLLISNRRQQLAETATYNAARSLLIDGKFNDVKAAVDRARAKSVGSPRLENLAAQALRHIPCPIAYSASGKLTQLGVGIGGIVARAPPSLDTAAAAQADQLLEAAAAEDVDAALNQSHLLLTLNQPEAAIEKLHAVVARHPKNPWVWLGLGNAHYLLNDQESAADAFRQCLKLDPENIAARMNLAMTMEEQGQPAAAMAAWEQLLTEHAGSLSEDERKQIDAQIQQLRDAAR